MFEANVNKYFNMKKLANLKGVKTLSSIEQKSVLGGRLRPGGCLSDCSGQPHGTSCYSADCTCPGMCSGGQCAMY